MIGDISDALAHAAHTAPAKDTTLPTVPAAVPACDRDLHGYDVISCLGGGATAHSPGCDAPCADEAATRAASAYGTSDLFSHYAAEGATAHAPDDAITYVHISNDIHITLSETPCDCAASPTAAAVPESAASVTTTTVTHVDTKS